MPAAPRVGARRLWALTAAAVFLSLALFARYGRQPDTATLQILGHALTSPAGTDSTFYMQMGEDAFQAPPHSIYGKLFFADHQKFIYPPSSLFLLELMNATRVPGHPGVALRILLFISWLGVLAAAVLLYRKKVEDAGPLEYACIAILGVLFLPIAEAFYRGQVQLLLTFFWAIAVLLWMHRKPGAAGFLIALTCAFKPQLAVFLLWGLFRRQWRFAVVMSATLGVIAACSVAYFGLRNNLDYLSVLGYLGRHGEAFWPNQSFTGLQNRLLGNGDPMSWRATVYPPYRPAIYVVGTALSIGALFVALLLPRFARWQSTTADFLFLGCTTVLLSPIAWEQHYAYFYFLIVYLLARAKSLPALNWLMLCVCTLAMANRLPPLDHRLHGVTSLAGSYLLYAGLGLLSLLALEQRRNA